MSFIDLETGATASDTLAGVWWSYQNLEEAADPLDATADEAAASCLSDIRLSVCNHITARSHDVALSLAKAGPNSSASSLYELLHLTPVLTPLLRQLRLAMTRVWKEKTEAEEAEQSNTFAVRAWSAVSPTPTHAATQAAGDGAMDIATLSRLLPLQQQFYQTFWAAVLEGVNDGLESVRGGTTIPATHTAVAVEQVMDDLFTSMFLFVINQSGDAAIDADAPKASWNAGLLPSYLKAVAATRCLGSAADSTVAIPPPPTACMVAYMVTFLQEDLGLSPVEQAKWFPRLCHAAQQHMQRQLDDVRGAATMLVESTDSATVLLPRVAAYISYTTACLHHLTQELVYDAAQSSSGSNTVNRCLGPAPPAILTAGSSTSAHMGEEAGRWCSAAPLLTCHTFQDSGWLLQQVEQCVAACKQVRQTARDAAVPQEKSTLKEPLKLVEDAWLSLRRQTLRFSTVLCTSDESSLLIIPYIRFIAQLFYDDNTVSTEDGETPLPSHNAWKSAIRAMHRVSSDVNSSSSGGTSRSGASVGTTALNSQPRRCHFTATETMSFAETSLLCFNNCIQKILAKSPDWEASPLVEKSVTGESSSAGLPTPCVCLPLLYSLLHQPLVVFRRLFRQLLPTSAISTECWPDEVVSERNSRGTARARALSDIAPASLHDAAQIFFPQYYNAFSAIEGVLQQAAAKYAAFSADAASPLSVLHYRRLMAAFIGAAIDDCFISEMKYPNDEVAGSQLLMFGVMVVDYGSDCSDDLPCLREALHRFIGSSPTNLLRYLHHHVVEQQRFGLMAFFLPLLRALGLDWGSVRGSLADGNEGADDEMGMALASPYPISASMAIAWELPRCFFVNPIYTASSHTAGMRISEAAHPAAVAYLTRLLGFTGDADGTRTAVTGSEDCATRTLFVEMIKEVGKAAMQHCTRSSSTTASIRAPSSSSTVAMDVQAAVYFGMCRLCQVAVEGWSPEQRVVLLQQLLVETAAPPPSKPITAKSAEDDGTTMTHPLLRWHEAKVEVAGEGPLCQMPLHWTRWFWSCRYSQLDARQMDVSTKKLLRLFSVQNIKYISTKTILRLRAEADQQTRREEAGMAAVSLALERAVAADLAALQQHVHHVEREKERAKKEAAVAAAVPTDTIKEAETTDSQGANESSVVEEKQDATECAEVLQKEESVVATADAEAAIDADFSGTSIQGTEALHRYLRHVVHNVVQRSRLSPIDAATSAMAFSRLLPVWSGQHQKLPQPSSCAIDPSDVLLCVEIYVRGLCEMLPQSTCLQAAALTRALHIVIDKILLPYKKSFLEEVKDSRIWAGCLPDVEGDAFGILQRTIDCVVEAMERCLVQVSVLGDWVSLELLRQAAPLLSLVRKSFDRVRVLLRHRCAKTQYTATKELHRVFLDVEKSVSSAGSLCVDDVRHLFTRNPPPVAVARTTTAPSSAAGGYPSSRKKYTDRVDRSRHMRSAAKEEGDSSFSKKRRRSEERRERRDSRRGGRYSRR